MDNLPEKKTKSIEFQAFEELTAKLLAVPKKEMDEKEQEYKRERKKRKKVTTKSRRSKAGKSN